MAVEIRVLKNGKPQSGIKVSYMRSMSHGSEKFTDSQGYVSYQVDPGMTLWVKIGNQNSPNFIWKKEQMSSESDSESCNPIPLNYPATLAGFFYT